MLRVAVIADDLTGAADTGIQFCRPEAPTYLLGLDHIRTFPFPESPYCLSLFTNTRNQQPEQAGETLKMAACAIKNLRPSHIYKKMDSGLRGNIGAELDALVESLGFEVSFVAPAFPAQSRITLHDVHYLHGVPLAQTEMARDPVSPVSESRISVLLSRQSQHPIGRVDLNILDRNSEELVGYIRHWLLQGVKHIVFDAATQSHLDTIANLAIAHFPRSLPVGSAGLASSLSGLLSPGTAGTRDLQCLMGNRILFVCGSASEVLSTQVDQLIRSSDCSSYFLDPLELVSLDRAERIAELSREAAGNLAARSVVLKIKSPVLSLSPAKGHELLKGLTDLVLSVLNDVRPDGILLSGGDTALAVWNALQAEALLLAQELLPGFVLGTFCKGSLHGLPVVTKAGAFGASDALVRIYEMLTSGKDQSHGSKQ
jgi:D-threonate/D-erythronate kinase